MSKLAFTFALAAVVAAATALARAPTRTVRAAPTADVQATARPSSRWSRPAKLSNCAANPAAHVVFPSDSPTHATGQGAIVWNASSACPGGEGARLSPLSPTDLPGATLIPRTSHGRVIAPRGELVASGAPGGEIVLAGASRMGPVHGLVIQGAARGPFSELHSPAGSGDPMALTTAYLGDVALASAPAGLGNETGLNVHVERFFAQSFDRNVSVRAPGAGPMHELTLAMDFRSEALAVWEQDGAIYARLVPNGGRVRPLQRLAYVGSHPRIAAVISDDNRAIVAWSEQHGTQTSVYVDRSALGVRFGAPQLLERFRDPDGLASPAGSPRLVRLSSESVLLAWASSAAEATCGIASKPTGLTPSRGRASIARSSSAVG